MAGVEIDCGDRPGTSAQYDIEHNVEPFWNGDVHRFPRLRLYAPSAPNSRYGFCAISRQLIYYFRPVPPSASTLATTSRTIMTRVIFNRDSAQRIRIYTPHLPLQHDCWFGLQCFLKNINRKTGLIHANRKISYRQPTCQLNELLLCKVFLEDFLEVPRFYNGAALSDAGCPSTSPKWKDQGENTVKGHHGHPAPDISDRRATEN